MTGPDQEPTARELELEAELRRLQGRVADLESLVQNSPDIIARFDRSLRHLYVNNAIEVASGLPASAYIGKDHYELGMPRALVDPWRESYRQVFATGREGKKVFDFPDENGELRSYVSRIVPERGSSGEVESVLSVTRDVTDWKRAEAHRVEAERKLLQTSTLESLGVLAGGLAHDFNNLLTGVLAGVSVLRRRSSFPEAVSKSADHIDAAARRASELCTQLLAFAGRSQFNLSVFELGALTEDTVALVASSVPAKVSVVTERLDHGRYIHGDASQVRQVILNLVLNAIEAIGSESAGRVVLRTEVVSSDEVAVSDARVAPGQVAGEYVRLTVIDEGCGADADTLDRMFDPFYSTKLQGRGLGLSAALGVLRRHAGVLRVESTPSVGTTFWVHLPVTTMRPSSVPSAATQAEDSISGPLLIVDDDATVLGAAELMARSIGLNPITASSGEEALVRIERGDEIGAVLLDVTMPGMGGIETLQAIRKVRPELCVVLSSGYSAPSIDDHGGGGFDAFLEKPYSETELRAALRAARSAGRAFRPAASAP